jgi:PhnB protein
LEGQDEQLRAHWISAVVEDGPTEEGMRRLSEPAYADAMREAQETLDRSSAAATVSSQAGR